MAEPGERLGARQQPQGRPAIQAINQVLFTRLKQLILDQSESKTRRNWIFLDEVRQAGRLAALTDLMVEGRSKGACVVLGFQDIEGMKHVHTTHLANELIGQAHNVVITKLVNPETAAHASQRFGEYEQTEENESVTESAHGRSRTVSASRVKHVAVMPSQLMSILMPSPNTGLTFYAIVRELEAYRETMSGKEVASMLCPPNADPARGGMANREPVPAEWQKLRPWSLADHVRLKLRPSVKELRKNLQLVAAGPAEGPPKRPAARGRRKRGRGDRSGSEASTQAAVIDRGRFGEGSSVGCLSIGSRKKSWTAPSPRPGPKRSWNGRSPKFTRARARKMPLRALPNH